MATKSINNKQLGLTVIEVIFAIVLFAGAMVTLIGLQSSNLARTREDRGKIRAMLAAREILSAIDTIEDPMEAGIIEGSIYDVMAKFITTPNAGTNSLSSEKIDPHEGLMARVEIENVPLPQISQSAMRKITLSIFWGAGPFDRFITTYFTPGDLQ